jgi:RNA-directed DNA polymerase
MRPAPPTIVMPTEWKIRSLCELAHALDCEEGALVAMTDLAPSLYSVFRQPKKSGGFREIRPPKKSLRLVQKRIYRMLEGRVRYPRWMMGGVPRRSIFMHAELHVRRQMVATLDVKSFFPSVRTDQVRSIVERFGISDFARDAVVRLTTLENQLPQGSPVSCFLANMIFDSIDRRVDALCRRHKLAYSRYVDDLAISGDFDFRHLRGAFIAPIEEPGFVVAQEKIHFMRQGTSQVVTNLCVNDKLRPTKAFIHEVKEDIWACLKGCGPELLALEKCLSIGALRSRLSGRVGHIAQADPRLGRLLQGRLCGISWHTTRHHHHH